jgi:hypothetical protein
VSERCAMLGCRQPASPLPLRVDEPQLPGPFEVALCPEHLEGWERQLGALAGREGELPMSDASWRALQLGAEALRGLARERELAGKPFLQTERLATARERVRKITKGLERMASGASEPSMEAAIVGSHVTCSPG